MYEFLKDLKELCKKHQVEFEIYDRGDDESFDNKSLTYWVNIEFLKKKVFNVNATTN